MSEQNAAPAPDALPVCDECERLRKDAARFAAWFGNNDDGELQYRAINIHWVGRSETRNTLDAWRAAIDAAMEKP